MLDKSKDLVNVALVFLWALRWQTPHWCFCVGCLLTDSSLSVKDVVKEFQPGGHLVQHKHGEVRSNHTWPNVIRSHDQIITFRPHSAGRVTASLFSFYFCPQCVDAAGFCLFLKTYLEAEDFPSDFCHRLYRYFQHAEQDDSSKRGTWVKPAILLQTTESHALATPLSCRRSLSSRCVLLLLSAGGWTTKRQARMWVSSTFCICDIHLMLHVKNVSALRLDLTKVRVKKMNHCLSLICM